MAEMRPACGDVILVDLDPTRGHEQSGLRPALIVSVDRFNQGPAGLLIVVPLTTKARGIPTHVPIEPPEGGLNRPSFAMTEAVRSISVDRLVKRLGAVARPTLEAVQDCLKILLGL